MPASVTCVRIDLPTPDIVIVRGGDGGLILFADTSLPAETIERAITDIDQIVAGPTFLIGSPA
jgi:hypothetical protein